MTKATDLLVELQVQLSQLQNPGQAAELNDLALSDLPAEDGKLSAILSSLLSEANLHLSETWAAHMTPAVSSISLLGQLIAGLHNGNLVSPQLYPVLEQIEQQTLEWLCRLFKQHYGHFLPSSSYANLEALWQAKQHKPNSSRIVYASSAVHYSIAKACQILDLKLITIKTDDNDVVSLDALKQACLVDKPLVIIATAGTSATGVFDPLNDCIEIAKQHDAWCHIDAAWGGALRILPEYDDLFTNLAQADSICFDPHKAWSQPKPSSIVLYRRALKPLLSADSHYLEQTPNNSLPGSYGGELFLPLWLSLMASGADKLRQHLRKTHDQAEQFARALEQNTHWPVYRSPTGIVCFKTTRDVDLTKLIEAMIISKAKRAGQDIYRVVFTSPHARAERIITELQPYF